MSLLDNLISYWTLDETSGNRADSHGSNTLTDNNTTGSGTGKIGTAADFDSASTEYLSCADNTDLSMGDIDFTISLWVNAETLGADRDILTKDNQSNPNREYGIGFQNSTSRFRFLTWNASDGLTLTTLLANTFGAPSTATWYHILVWHDATANELGISVNRVEDTVSHTTGVRDGTTAFRIGNRGNNSTYWNGLVDEVGIWKRVLTSGERDQLYNGGSGLAYSSFGGATAVPVFVHHYQQQGAV